MPNDFFYSMNEGAGKNLNWFWKKWFFEGGMPDLAIRSAKRTGNRMTVVVVNKGGKPVPVDLQVTYADGSREKIHKTIAVWEKGAAATTVIFPVTRPVSKLMLSDPHTPDSFPKDNVFEFK
jgi:hypothetical protein